MGKMRRPGGGRKKSKPEYDAGKNLKEQMENAVALYEEDNSLQTIAAALNLNPIKIRKLLITAGVYESEMAERVKNTFEEYRRTQDYKASILSTAATLQLSRSSVTSYLPYEKGVYFSAETGAEKISVGAERQRRYRAVGRLREKPTEEHLWTVILAYQNMKCKSLTWSSLLLALSNIAEVGAVVERPKALGDIRGVTYIYGMFYRFGLIEIPEKAKDLMGTKKMIYKI